jgi:hypothetical protein
MIGKLVTAGQKENPIPSEIESQKSVLIMKMLQRAHSP